MNLLFGIRLVSGGYRCHLSTLQGLYPGFHPLLIPSSENMAENTKHPEVDLSQVPFEALVREMIVRLDPEPDRDGMDRTPQRVAESMKFLTRGYSMTPEEAIGDGIFDERHHNMVLVKDIELYSMCEHHLLPFFGKAHVAYIPDGQIMGLSKAARLVEVFSRRFQVQERLTEQVAQAVWDTIHPMGVGVVIEAFHLCMMMRGVEKQNSKTITSAMRGVFLSDKKTRDEFLRLSMSGHVLLS
jgi:GTP cyclohydrolase I